MRWDGGKCGVIIKYYNFNLPSHLPCHHLLLCLKIRSWKNFQKIYCCKYPQIIGELPSSYFDMVDRETDYDEMVDCEMVR